MWNISNLLSLFRLILAVPISIALMLEHPFIAFILGIFAFISDYLDGYYARKLNQVTEIGKIIDPLADKIVVISVVLVLFLQEKFPLSVGIAIIIRDILILLGGILLKKKLGYVLPSNFAGKLTVTIIAVYIFCIILNITFLVLIGPYIVVTMVAYSFITYLVRAVKILREK